MPSTAVARLIAKLELFVALAADERKFLLQSFGEPTRYDRGQEVVAEGSSPDASCLVVEGIVCRSKTLADGDRQILALHLPGDFADLHSFVLPVMDHSIEAVTPCSIVKMPHGRLRTITDEFANLTRALWYDTAVDAAIHREWMLGLGLRSAYERLAHLICELFVRMRFCGLTEGNSFPLKLTQGEVGELFGISTVHLNRMVQALRKAKLVELQGHTVTLLNFEGLKDVAGFDPKYLEGRDGKKGGLSLEL